MTTDEDTDQSSSPLTKRLLDSDWSEWEEVFHCDGQCVGDTFCGVIDHVVLTRMWSMSGGLHSSTAATGLDGDESPL